MYGKKEKGMNSMGPGKPMMKDKLMKPAAKKMASKSKTAAKKSMPKRKAM